MAEFEILLGRATGPSVICITEHWLREEELPNIKITNYKIAAAFCRRDFLHGGVLILTHDKIEVETLNVGIPSEEKCYEACAVKLPALKTIVVAIYRSPMGDISVFLKKLEGALVELEAINCEKIILAGDFNINFMSNNVIKDELIKLISSFNMELTFGVPSRMVNGSFTCPDNIITNFLDDILKRETINLHLGDHHSQRITYPITAMPETKKSIIKRRIVSERNIYNLKLQLAAINWNEIVNEDDPEKCFDGFHSSVVHALDASMPLTSYHLTESNRTLFPAFREELRRMRNSLDALYTISQFEGPEAFRAYLAFKNIYRKRVQEVKKESASHFVKNATNKQKAIWQVINQYRPKKRERRNVDVSANGFREYLEGTMDNTVDSATKNNALLLLRHAKINNVNSFHLREFTESDILRSTALIKPKPTNDCYGINTKLIKVLVPLIIEPLTLILNRCMQAGVFPSGLKSSEIKPIYKKGDANRPESYRPISILPAFSKIFEHLVMEELVQYLTHTKSIRKEQHGFQKGKSTQTAILQMVNDAAHAFDRKLMAQATYLDLSKAFDVVRHQTLLDKMEHYGIRGLPHDLIRSYLENRKQRVVVEQSKKSDWFAVGSGVPQGSLLGPLLFIVYINDSVDSIPADGIYLYADDSTFLNVAKNITIANDMSETSMKKAEAWYIANNLSLNKEKTNKLTFSTVNVGFQDPIRFLGVWMQADLKWDEHIKRLNGKLSSAVYTIRYLVREASFEAALTSYYANFHSHLAYGIIVWGSSGRAHEILQIQKRAIRALYSLPLRESCRGYFASSGILTVFNQYILTCLIQAHKHKNLMVKNRDFHHHFTRNNNRLALPYHRIQRTQGAEYWQVKFANLLPSEIWELHEAGFRGAVLRCLRRRPLYSLDELFCEPMFVV